MPAASESVNHQVAAVCRNGKRYGKESNTNDNDRSVKREAASAAVGLGAPFQLRRVHRSGATSGPAAVSRSTTSSRREKLEHLNDNVSVSETMSRAPGSMSPSAANKAKAGYKRKPRRKNTQAKSRRNIPPLPPLYSKEDPRYWMHHHSLDILTAAHFAKKTKQDNSDTQFADISNENQPLDSSHRQGKELRGSVTDDDQPEKLPPSCPVRVDPIYPSVVVDYKPHEATNNQAKHLGSFAEPIVVEPGSDLPDVVQCNTNLVVFSQKGDLSSLVKVVEHWGKLVRLKYPDGFVTAPLSLEKFKYKVLPW